VGFKRFAVAGLPAALMVFGSALVAPVTAASPAASVGQWSAPFEEPTGKYTEPAGPTEHCTRPDSSGYKTCKPAAVSASVVPDGRVVYWNGLSDLENVQNGIVAEAGGAADSSEARVLDLRSGTPRFSDPTPVNGAGPEPCDMPNACGATVYPLPGNNGPDPNNNSHDATHDMFCSDNVGLADGRILVSGGTRWYQQPGVPGTPYGVAELQGLRLSQVFDPRTNTFTRVAPMNNGRWYPDLVIEGTGNVFVGGGVRKLIQTDGTNVRQTETYDVAANRWTVNPGGDAALPLFPRFHLLPDGSIYYSGAGQMWGPAGESADEALYALHQSYDPGYNDPVTGHWHVFGVGSFGARSGAFSTLLPLKAPYNSADVLVGGGTLGPPPGGYIATNFSEVAHFSAANQWQPTFSTGPNLTRDRWFSTSVTLPNDAVAVFNGANRDEVVDPGNESPVRQAEWYAPWDGQFHALSSDNRDRTYHNTAILLPDASVLVGGHAPIAANYASTSNTEHDATAGTPVATDNNFRDPSFEVYKPPYLFAGDRPEIARVQSGIAWGRAFEVETEDAAQVTSVRLIRLPSLTHTVDANMRSVELPFTRRPGKLEVQGPPTGNVAPPGNYYLFINRGSGAGTVPSTAAIVRVGSTTDPAAALIPFKGGRGDASLNVQRGTASSAHGAAGAGSPPAADAPAGAATAAVPALSAAMSSRARLPQGGGNGTAAMALAAGLGAAAAAVVALRRRRRPISPQ
jgi:hypothetical protein